MFFVKVVVVLILWFAFVRESKQDHPSDEQKAYDNLVQSGQTDPCDGSNASNVNFQKQLCNKAAIKAGFLKKDEEIVFSSGFPRCPDASIACNANKHSTVKAKLLYCNTEKDGLTLGKGDTPNGVIMYGCEDVCYIVGEVSDVFTDKNKL